MIHLKIPRTIAATSDYKQLGIGRELTIFFLPKKELKINSLLVINLQKKKSSVSKIKNNPYTRNGREK